MPIYLPSRDECCTIVQNSDAFYCIERTIEGYPVEIYDYRLAGYADFFPEDGTNRTELRGITFVQDDTGTWHRHILLNKFFNVNQTIGWMYDDLKDKRITRIQNKEDGSIISFVKFPNGIIKAKSKTSFDSIQAQMAQTLYENDPFISSFVEACFSQDLTPIFELVSPDNQIVLEYTDTKLVLLQLRRSSGEYILRHEMRTLTRNLGIELAEDFQPIYGTNTSPLDHLLELKATSQEDIEGWVVTFKDGQMAKIKTDKYLQLHGLIGPDAMRENLLIAAIINSNIDDILSNLVPGIKKTFIEDLTEKIEHHFNQLVQEYIDLRGLYFNKFQEDRKAFSLAHRTDRMFSSLMKTIHTSFRDVEKTAEQVVREYILSQTKSLSKAKFYIKAIK